MSATHLKSDGLYNFNQQSGLTDMHTHAHTYTPKNLKTFSAHWQ